MRSVPGGGCTGLVNLVNLQCLYEEGISCISRKVTHVLQDISSLKNKQI
jgi:hypothetical protein